MPQWEEEGTPPESATTDRPTLSEPPEQREGLKWQHVDEEQPRSGGPTLKCHCPVAPRLV